MTLSELIKEILSEWGCRVDDGMPDPKNPQHLKELVEVLEVMGLSSIKNELIGNLLEGDNFKNPALNKVVRYKDVHGEDAEGKVGNLMRRPSEEDAHQKAVSTLGGEDSDRYKEAMQDLGGEGQPEKKDEKEKGNGEGGTPSVTGTAFDTTTDGGKEYIDSLPDNDPASEEELDIKEAIVTLGELLSEASIFDSKYSTGDKFLALKQTQELFSKAIPSGEKIPKGPFTKENKTDKSIEIQIGDGPTVYVSADDTNKTYKITASQNQFKALFGKMKNKAGVGSISWSTEVLETAACFGLYINGISVLNSLNSAKGQDDIINIISQLKDKINSAISSSGEYANASEIQSKLETMPLTDWYLLAQLMAGMTKFTNNILTFKPVLIHKSIKKYYSATERSDLVDGVKDNTADAVVTNVSVDELISKLQNNYPVEYDNSGVCSIKGTNIKFIQVSLKKGKDVAQLGKIYGFLKDKYNLLSNEDVLNLAVNEGFSDFFKKGIDFIKKAGTEFLQKISAIGKLLSGFGKKIGNALTKVPKKNIDDLEMQLRKAGMRGSLKESMNELSENKISMWDSFDEISKNQELLDIIAKNTNSEFSKLKQASDKNKSFYYKGYKQLNPKAPISKDNVAKLITNFQSAIVLQNVLGDIEGDSKKLYSQLIELEKEMVYGKTTLPLYKVYGLSKDGSGTAYEPYPGSEKYIETKMDKDLSDVVVFYLYSSDKSNYFTLRAYGLSGISEETGELKYSQFRMGTNESGRYSYNFEGTQEISLGQVKKSLGI
jgi:hypothetical protein